MIQFHILNGSKENDDISCKNWKSAYTDICDKHAPMIRLRLKIIQSMGDQ